MMCAKIASRVALDSDSRVVTGIPGFDEMLEGGFPAGSLISLAGRPGTGKTIFGSQFLFFGAKELKEPGMYDSMLEGRKAYVRNMLRLGFDIKKKDDGTLSALLDSVDQGARNIAIETATFKIRDTDVCAEAIQQGFFELVERDACALWWYNRASRSGIDLSSFDDPFFAAMTQAFERIGDLRVFTHMLLGKIVGGAGCTTLMITETAHTDVLSSVGIQEFIADGVIHFSLVPITGEARVRYIEITKMRGTNHQMGLLPVEIGNRGISVKVPHITAR